MVMQTTEITPSFAWILPYVIHTGVIFAGYNIVMLDKKYVRGLIPMGDAM
jgi:endonuclease V-like protein UPF0215 family